MLRNKASLLATLLLPALGCADKPLDSADPGEKAAPCEAISGNICTFIGTETAGYNGDGVYREEAWLYFPADIEFSPYGKPAVLDWNNHKVRLIEDDGTLTTVIGTDFVGNGDPEQKDMTEEGADGTDVSLNHPSDVVYFEDGTLLLSSWHTHMLRTWDTDTGKVHVVLGSAPGFEGDGMTSENVLMNQPVNATIDYETGDVYIVDMRNERVRVWYADDDVVNTVAGNGDKGYSGDGGPGTEAAFNVPKAENPEIGGATELGPDGRLYIADTENHRIRVLDLDTGIVDTYAGTGEAGFSGDGGDALGAQLNFPRDLEITPEGVMLIADEANGRIRAIDMDTGVISTIAGTGEQGFDGDGGPALEATFNRPFGVEWDEDGNIYVADFNNHRIRVIYN